MNLSNCFNFHDFRKLAHQKLPSPIFNYIDGGADDELTYKRNTEAFNNVDLIPNVLRGVENVDLSTTIFGKKNRFASILFSYSSSKAFSL
ncbi:MAG: alpha-hydroxy-acid oxidizing protein [Burkholderiaceae bacterium]